MIRRRKRNPVPPLRELGVVPTPWRRGAMSIQDFSIRSNCSIRNDTETRRVSEGKLKLTWSLADPSGYDSLGHVKCGVKSLSCKFNLLLGA
jgi:hypothetical protein